MSEDEFFQVMFPQAATPGTPRVLPLLELMFGPGARREGKHVFRVGKRSTVARILPDEATFWPTSATKPFAVLHVGPIRKSALMDACSRKSDEDVEQGAVGRVIEEVLEGFGKSKGLDWQAEHGNPRTTVVVLSVQDGDAHVSYFGTRLDRGHYRQVNFALREPVADNAESREHLREFYEERVPLLRGIRWQTAFFLPDLRRRLSRDLPADWGLSQEAVTLELGSGISIIFDCDFSVRIKFREVYGGHWYSVPAPDSLDIMGRIVCQLLDAMLPNRDGAIKWCHTPSSVSMSEQQLADVISEFPSWLTSIFEAQLQQASEAGENRVVGHQKAIAAEVERIEFIRQAKTLLDARR